MGPRQWTQRVPRSGQEGRLTPSGGPQLMARGLHTNRPEGRLARDSHPRSRRHPMRARTLVPATILAISAIACSSKERTTAAKDDFKRDLQLASATTMDLAAPKVNP